MFLLLESRIRIFFLIQTSQLQMSRGGTRIDLQRLFKFVNGPFVIHARQTTFAGEEMGFLFLLQLALARGQTAVQTRQKQNSQNPA